MISIRLIVILAVLFQILILIFTIWMYYPILEDFMPLSMVIPIKKYEEFKIFCISRGKKSFTIHDILRNYQYFREYDSAANADIHEYMIRRNLEYLGKIH